jgi:hypothetical protein
LDGFNPIPPSTLESYRGDGSTNASQYQLEKYMKHTAPSGCYAINSVFDNPTWDNYQNYLICASASGCMEVDDYGRKRYIWHAGSTTGIQYNNGQFESTCSGITVVLAENVSHVHAYPYNFHPESRPCAKCGRLVPFDPSK